MDGVLADFGRAFHDVETRLFGPGARLGEGQPETEEQEQATVEQARLMGDATGEDARLKPSPAEAPRTSKTAARELRRRRDLIWHTIQSTPDFWLSLKPIDAAAVGRIHALMLQHRWEVFFITQRPPTDGQTVQRQTQHWLVKQGFDLPSVLVLGGSRGAAAGALRLNYHLDDSPQNCLEVIAASRAQPILIVPDDDETTIASARKLGIGTAKSIGACLDILESATLARARPGVLARLAQKVGWR